MVRKFSGIGVLLLLLSVAASAAHEKPRYQTPEELLARLEVILPSEPSGETLELLSLISEAGATKRLDAAVLLIRALAVNFHPGSSNEARSPVAMMPAANALMYHYGSQVLPLLMSTAISTEEEWLQMRIALVVRSMNDQDEVAKAKEAFSLKESLDPRARKFNSFLEQRQLDIKWANPALDDLEKFLENVRKNKERQVKPPKR